MQQYKRGEWLRVWSDWNKTTQMIGEVIGFGQARDHWTRTVTGQTIIIKNAQLEAHILPENVIEQIDPVEEWNRIKPDEPLPEYLVSRLKIRSLQKRGWQPVDWGQYANYKSQWWWNGVDKHLVCDLETAYMICMNDKYQEDLDRWMSDHAPRQMSLFY